MKKLTSFLFFSTVVFAFACHNDSSSKTSPDTSGTPNLTNVQNVNGNMPDTTTGIQLDTRQSPDTSKHTDTMHH